MERQDTADTVLRLKLHPQNGIKEKSSPFPALSNHFNYTQAKFESDALSSQLYPGQVSKRFGHFTVRYACWNGSQL